jgi:hypothetical protein
MTVSLEQHIRRRLQHYFEGTITLDAFVDWFWPATFDVGAGDDPSLVALVGEVQLRLAEFDRGHWTEAELHEQLHRIVRPTKTHALR